MAGFGWFNWPDATLDNIRALGKYVPRDDSLWQIDGIKLFVDGGIESALLQQPYCIVQGEQEDPTYRGVQVIETELLQEIVSIANRNNWRVGVHAVGDAGVDVVLEAYAKAHAERPIDRKRFVLIHGILPQPKNFPLLRALGIVVASQVHHHTLGENMIRYWGRDRAQRANPVSEYLRHGIPVTGGTDSMVCPYSQVLALWSWIARQTKLGRALGPELGLTREQALKLHTAWASYITFEEDRKGTIESGRYADFAVLSGNPLICPLDELAEIEVVQTVLGGRTVWHA
jgi:predicted amidohydrolase YtcJ